MTTKHRSINRITHWHKFDRINFRSIASESLKSISDQTWQCAKMTNDRISLELFLAGEDNKSQQKPFDSMLVNVDTISFDTNLNTDEASFWKSAVIKPHNEACICFYTVLSTGKQIEIKSACFRLSIRYDIWHKINQSDLLFSSIWHKNSCYFYRFDTKSVIFCNLTQNFGVSVRISAKHKMSINLREFASQIHIRWNIKSWFEKDTTPCGFYGALLR